jgi:hypothetical protein
MKITRKFKELHNKALEDNKSNRTYRDECRAAFGVRFDEDYGLVKDDSQQVADPRKISFQELAHEMIGRDYGDQLQNRYQEVSGGVVQPSSFQNINGFDSVAFSLLDALILEGYSRSTFIWQDWCDVQPTRTNGGKSVRAYFDDQTGASLEIGEEAPSVGLTQGYVKRQPNVRKAHKVMVTLESLLYDWTDTIQTAAVDSGAKIAYEIEKSVAKIVLGIVNNYERDGTSGNTFLGTKGTTPMNYKNTEINALATYASVQTALATLSANTDPYSGIPIGIDISKSKVLVPLAGLYDAKAILHATTVFRGSDLTAAFVAQASASPLEAQYSITASAIWDKVLADNNVTTFSWLLGEPKRAFGYRQLVPFNTTQLVLGPKEVSSNVALGVYVQEIGAPFVQEPRYVYKGTTS